jgi:hypothetical protein
MPGRDTRATDTTSQPSSAMQEASPGRQGRPPLVRPYDRELAGGDPYAQTMAWILDLLTVLTAANFAGFAAVNARGDLT